MYLCPTCGRQEPDDAPVWRCTCGSHLNYDGAPLLRRADIRTDEHSLWRYDAALPIQQADAVAYFGEGMTPLLPSRRSDTPFLFKLETLMPSGSFKDRGSAVLANALRKIGIHEVVEDSSGNAGASLACYAARAGLDCEVYTPAEHIGRQAGADHGPRRPTGARAGLAGRHGAGGSGGG